MAYSRTHLLILTTSDDVRMVSETGSARLVAGTAEAAVNGAGTSGVEKQF